MEGPVSPVSLMNALFFSPKIYTFEYAYGEMSPCISLHEACNYMAASWWYIPKWLAEACCREAMNSLFLACSGKLVKTLCQIVHMNAVYICSAILCIRSTASSMCDMG